jgi:hypothetical protein
MRPEKNMNRNIVSSKNAERLTPLYWNRGANLENELCSDWQILVIVSQYSNYSFSYFSDQFCNIKLLSPQTRVSQ